MRRYLLMLGIMIVINSVGRSQTLNPNDTLCFKISEVQNVLIAAKQKKVVDSLLSICKDSESAYQIIVSELRQKDANWQQTVKLYQSQVSLLNTQIKKEKRKTRLVLFGGMVAIGGLTYLLITK